MIKTKKYWYKTKENQLAKVQSLKKTIEKLELENSNLNIKINQLNLELDNFKLEEKYYHNSSANIEKIQINN